MSDAERTVVWAPAGDATRRITVPSNDRLVLLSGPRSGESVLLAQMPFTIGRSNANHLVIADPAVSAFHARLVRLGDELWIEDLGSRNGTCVEGQTVERCILRGGERIHLGGAQLRFVRGGERYNPVHEGDPEGDTLTHAPHMRYGRIYRGLPGIFLAFTAGLVLAAAAWALFGAPPQAMSTPADQGTGAMLRTGAPASFAVPAPLPFTGSVATSEPVVAELKPATAVVRLPSATTIPALQVPVRRRVPAPAQPLLAEVVAVAIAQSDFVQALQQCGCPAKVREALLLLATPPQDLPAVLATAAALEALRQQSLLPLQTYTQTVDAVLAQADAMLQHLLDQGLQTNAKRALDRLANTLPSAHNHIARLSVSRILEAAAQAEVQRGRSLAGINAEAAAYHYRAALALAPDYTATAAHTRAALAALP